jgi:hypothetical protein
MKKLLYLLIVLVVFSSCEQQPFEGKISYEIEFETGFGGKLGFLDNLIGQATNSTVDLYIKEGNIMLITDPNNSIFGSFQGSFTKIIFDLENQEAFVVNDTDKTFTTESLLDSDIEGFNFKSFSADLTATKELLGTPIETNNYAGYECNTYEVGGTWIDGKVSLNTDLLLEMKSSISQIEGMENYDLTGLGFPLYWENKVFGIGMTAQASKVEHKTLEPGIFNIDGYREVNKIEFYQQNLPEINWEAFGLDDEMNDLKFNLDSISSDLMKDVGSVVDSIFTDIDAEGIMNELNNLFKGE